MNDEHNILPTEVAPAEVEGTSLELTDEQIQLLNSIASRANGNTLKQRLRGIPRLSRQEKQSRYWYMGSLITKAEHDKLTNEQVQESKAWEKARLKEKKAARKRS